MKYLLLIATAVIAMLFLFWKDVEDIIPNKQKKGKNKDLASGSAVKVLQQWDLPEVLKEVSGIAYIDEDRFAAIQDESGTIYIYNRLNKIEKEIVFGSTGDYEGLAVKGNTAFIVSADGGIYEVDMSSASPKAKEHGTTLTSDNDVEGLCYDEVNNRLLLAVKAKDLNSNDYKGIYAFNLADNQFLPEPVYKIMKDDPVFSGSKKKKIIMPSALGIHPSSKEVYVVDGPNARLLILDNTGKANRLIDLGRKFAQPEGITFSPNGDIFISNEGNNGAGNIIELQLSE